jgi:hypothetical protein
VASIQIPRLFTDAAGDSRFDTYELPMELHDHAPPAEPFLLAEPIPVTQCIFFRLPPRWNGAQHTTPNHRLVVCLSGVLRFIGSAGDSLTLHPGEKMMDMNTSGKGHATEVLSSEPVEGLIIRTP